MRPFVLILLVVLATGCSREQKPRVEPVYAPAVVADPEVEVMEKTFPKNFTGLVPKYYGYDSSRMDYLLVVKNGELKALYFFDRQRRLQEENHYDCRALHGQQKSYYANGQVKEMLEMDHGVRHGFHVIYDSTGRIRASEKWENGQAAGLIKVYDSAGIFTYAQRSHYREIFRKE